MLDKDRRRKKRQDKMPGDIFQGLVGELQDGVALMEPAWIETPEKRLCAEVLLDAVSILRRGDSGDADDPYWETRLWTRTYAPDVVFSFDFVCEHLGLEPSRLRTGMLAIKPQRVAAFRRSQRGYALRPRVSKRAVVGRPRNSHRYGAAGVA